MELKEYFSEIQEEIKNNPHLSYDNSCTPSEFPDEIKCSNRLYPIRVDVNDGKVKAVNKDTNETLEFQLSKENNEIYLGGVHGN